jgi:2-keto-4-pentenoate hydratase/2-oxohepta-3-ene-1,7-dioic acid hydratase in catechol pathway
LIVNGEQRFKTSTGLIMHNISKLLSWTSHYMTLNEGDLFLSGSPTGFGFMGDGDEISGTLFQGKTVLDKIEYRVKQIK